MLRQRSGSIVNVTSVSGIRGNPGQANYAASKAAIAAMTRTLAKELAKRSIRVNCVAPGFIDTDMVKRMDPRVVEEIVKRIPMQRLGLPAEVAKVVAFPRVGRRALRDRAGMGDRRGTHRLIHQASESSTFSISRR
jgi:3-oxoacyl-[acyl-carrier protein] reductase